MAAQTVDLQRPLQIGGRIKNDQLVSVFQGGLHVVVPVQKLDAADAGAVGLAGAVVDGRGVVTRIRFFGAAAVEQLQRGTSGNTVRREPVAFLELGDGHLGQRAVGTVGADVVAQRFERLLHFLHLGAGGTIAQGAFGIGLIGRRVRGRIARAAV